jgi:hypothetical protein
VTEPVAMAISCHRQHHRIAVVPLLLPILNFSAQHPNSIPLTTINILNDSLIMIDYLLANDFLLAISVLLLTTGLTGGPDILIQSVR